MAKLKKLNWMTIFFFFLPIIDCLSFLSPITHYINLGIKGVLLFYVLFYLIKNTSHKKIFAFLGIYFVVYFYYLFISHLNPWLNFSNTLTIFSLPIFILFFSNYQNENITKKTIMIVFFMYVLLYLFMSLFEVPFGVRLFPLFLLLFHIAFIYLLESHSYLLKGIYLLCFLLLTFVINAKSFFLSTLVILLYFLLTNLKKIIVYSKKNQLKVYLLITAFCLGFAVYVPKISLEKYQNDSFKDIFTMQNMNTLLSGRITNLSNVEHSYKESTAIEKVLGFGVQKLNTIHDVESDIFDIYYCIGIVGLLFYLIFFFYVLGFCNLHTNYKFIFILFLILSYLGNIFLNPYFIPFFGLLFLISKNDHGKMKKDILLVSNMYPSKDNPHYGVFVKNTYELLKQENYTMDLVVMYKTIGKLGKLIAYIKMCGVSLLKAVFNNYDYIYVHFVSHTTAGVFIPSLCCKNTKLVLNVHGNDLVPDTKTDKHYLKLTRIFLKGADIVISPSKYFQQILVKEFHIPKEKIVIYPSSGINLEQFKKINKKTAIKNANLDSKYKYFGYISRIEKNKGYDTYIKAINELQKDKKYKNIRFLLVGSGSEEDKCNALIKKFKLEKVIIRKPLVSQEELVSIYNSLEVFIYPTRMQSESLGLTGLEAMACETLVIGSNQFGPSEYLMNNENALTFKPTDYKELKEKMVLALEMKAKEKNKLTKNAQKKSEEYSSEATKGILLDVFK